MSLERIDNPSEILNRKDHILRYKLAAKFARKINASSIVDCAAGIGYGSNLLARALPTARITGIELSKQAAKVFDEYFRLNNINYVNSNYKDVPIKMLKSDLFVSFEFIEHIWDSEIFLHKISISSKFLILSTPNELVRPHKLKPINEHHVKHFRPYEMKTKLERHGFKILSEFSQVSGSQPEIKPGLNGKFMIFIAKNTKT